MESLRFQKRCPYFVMFHFYGGTMLGAIQFYHQFCLVAVKIHDVIPYHILSSESVFGATQILIPKMRFFLRHLLAQILRICFEFFVLFHNLSA